MSKARTTRAKSLVAVALTLPLIGAMLLLAAESPASTRSRAGCTGRYGWPVEPFDREHPVRANFGDPRTHFDGPQSSETLLRSAGTFSYHQGVDISAPDGSPVYAVASGRVVYARGARVTVKCSNGRSFQYWHIEPAVRAGQYAVAGQTVVGFIQPKREHVHLTHLERYGAVNPLTPGRLTPYEDRTKPQVLGISVSRLAGRVTFVAEAIDTPATPVPGRWRGFPVTPVQLAWRIERDGGVVEPTHVAHDVMNRVPRNKEFWRTFAPGTHQNWPVFDGQKARYLPGRYLFRLAELDVTSFLVGAYTLVVTASDTAGNRDVVRLPFVIGADGNRGR
jgi:hypothetical protein